MYWPGDHACVFPDNVKNDVITCCPKGHEIGDLNELVTSEHTLEDVIKEDYGFLNYKSRNMMRDFCDTMKEGDIIVARSADDFIVGVAEVKGEYFFDNKRENFKHCRKVEWLWCGEKPAREYLTKGSWNRVTMVPNGLRKETEALIASLD